MDIHFTLLGGFAVTVSGGPSLAFGEPVRLFEAKDFRRSVNRPSYDVSADGRRFLMVRPVSAVMGAELVYAQNFVAELRAKLRP